MKPATTDLLLSLAHGLMLWSACVLPAWAVYSRRGLTRLLFGYAAGLGCGIGAAITCLALLETGADQFSKDLVQAFGLPLIGLALARFGKSSKPPRQTRTVPAIRQSINPWTGAPFEPTRSSEQ